MMGNFIAYYGRDDCHGQHDYRQYENCYEHHHAGNYVTHSRCNYNLTKLKFAIMFVMLVTEKMRTVLMQKMISLIKEDLIMK